MNVHFTTASQPVTAELEALFIDETANGPLLCNGDDDTVPMPWDAGFDIVGSNVVISGSVCGHGIGNVRIEVPLKNAVHLYSFELEPNSDKAGKRIAELLKQLGYRVTC